MSPDRRGLAQRALGDETDAHHGKMLPTRWRAAMPYVRQVLAGFGVVWSRSRLMRLAPGARVPDHADINYRCHSRVRQHIPIITWPEVLFHCDDALVHMAAGEAWIFDNWRRYRLENGGPWPRVHLVADTTGTAAFWHFARGLPPPRVEWPMVKWDQDARQPLLIERGIRSQIMPAAELQLLVGDFIGELTVGTKDAQANASAAVVRLRMLLEAFVFDWRQLCALHRLSGVAREKFLRLVQALRTQVDPHNDLLVMRTNGASAALVLEKLVLEQLVLDQ